MGETQQIDQTSLSYCNFNNYVISTEHKLIINNMINHLEKTIDIIRNKND